MRHLVAPLLAVPILALVPAGPARAAGTCQGLPATIESSDLDITGTEGPDVILATRAAHIRALGGDDVICAAGGTLDAGTGNDSVLVYTYGGINLEDADLGPGVNRYTSTADMIDTVTSGVPTEPNLDVIDTGIDLDGVNVVLSPGSHPQVSAERLTVEAVTGDAAAWDVQLPSAITRDGVSMGTFTGVSSLGLDLGPSASVAVHGTNGNDNLRLGAGTVDVDLGGGNDFVFLDRFHTVSTSGRFDFGDGTDAFSVDSLTPFSLDLRKRAANALQIGGLESSTLSAPKIWYRGSRRKDVVHAIGCRVVLRGGSGNDVLSYAIEDERPSTPQCEAYRFRMFGQAGNDHMTGWRGRDVLDGGEGRDEANGKQNIDVCRAEKERQCER